MRAFPLFRIALEPRGPNGKMSARTSLPDRRRNTEEVVTTQDYVGRVARFGSVVVIGLCAIAIATGVGTLFFNEPYTPLFDHLLGGHGIAASYLGRFVASTDARTRTALHVLPGLVWMLVVPLQFSGLRRRSIRAHRVLGRIVLLCAAFASAGMLTLLAMPYGAGNWELIPNLLFGSLFVVSGTLAFASIRRKRVTEHREWVIRHVAVGMGIALMRPVAVVAFQTGFVGGSVPQAQEFFPYLFWIGFVLSVIVAEIWIKVTRGRRPNSGILRVEA
jgi:hypothetical protein